MSMNATFGAWVAGKKIRNYNLCLKRLKTLNIVTIKSFIKNPKDRNSDRDPKLKILFKTRHLTCNKPLPTSGLP